MHIDADTLRHLPQGLQTLIENANPPPPASTAMKGSLIQP